MILKNTIKIISWKKTVGSEFLIAGSIESTSIPINAGIETPRIIVKIIRKRPPISGHLLPMRIGNTLQNQFLVLSGSIVDLGSENRGSILTG